MATSPSPQPQTDAPSAGPVPPNRPSVHIHFTPTNTGATGFRITSNNPNPQNSTPQPHGNVRRIALPPIVPPPPLPPLEPQPLPYSRPTHEESESELKKFECAICFEYLNTPVGCGSCAVRFCKRCLERTILQELKRSPSSSNQQQPVAKCPHCRTALTPSSIRLDTILLSAMNSCPILIECPFVGCSTQTTLRNLAQHEKSCPHLPIKCRYAPYGCLWTGKSSSLTAHEETCTYHTQFKSLIENIRRYQWENQFMLKQHHSLMNLNHALIHANRQLIETQSPNSCKGNVWHVFQLLWEATCFPDRFVKNAVFWGITSEQERAMVCNIAILWPWIMIVFRVGIVGMQHVPRLVQVMVDGDKVNEMWQLLDIIGLSGAIGIMGCLVLACFYADGTSSTEWTSFSIFRMSPQPILRDVAACCMAMITFGWMEFLGPIRGFILWCLGCNLSLVYTAFLAGMMEKTGVANVIKSARARQMVVFGLCYGCLVYGCGLLPSVAAILVVRLVPAELRSGHPLVFGDTDSECFLARIDGSHVLIATMAFLATVSSINSENILQTFVEVTAAIFFFISINVYIALLEKSGRKLAALNVIREGVNNNNATIPASGVAIELQRPTPVGAFVAAAVLFTSVLIATI